MILRGRRITTHGILFGLLVYLAFLGQEVLLTRVWCHKFDGSRDLEFALVGDTCSCRHTHGDEQRSGRVTAMKGIVESYPANTSCFNVPLSNSSQVRVKSDTIPLTGGPSVACDRDIESEAFQTLDHGCRPKYILFKFLSLSDSPDLMNVLLC